MQLWMGLQYLGWRAKQPVYYEEVKYNMGFLEFKDYVRKIKGRMRAKDIETFPNELNPGCRCKDCRYHRIFRRK